MLKQRYVLSFRKMSKKAMHDKMKFLIVVLDRHDKSIDLYLSSELFFYFSNNCMLDAFSWFNFATGKFPGARKLAISSLRGKKSSFLFDDGRNNFNGVHVGPRQSCPLQAGLYFFDFIAVQLH